MCIRICVKIEMWVKRKRDGMEGDKDSHIRSRQVIHGFEAKACIFD